MNDRQKEVIKIKISHNNNEINELENKLSKLKQDNVLLKDSLDD